MVNRRRDAYLACTAVQASQSRGTVHSRFVGQSHIYVAFRSRETRWTRARVQPLARVEARAAVLARCVIGAIVQILIAKHASPSFFAQALPRFLAITVHATRIYLTLVASFTGPTQVTSARKGKNTHSY